VAFGPFRRSTMRASPMGMMLAASPNQPSTWGSRGAGTSFCPPAEKSRCEWPASDV
jgi:hypothetical protein